MNHKFKTLSFALACLPLAVNAATEADVNQQFKSISTEQTSVFGTNVEVEYQLKALGKEQVGIYEGDIILGEHIDLQDFGASPFAISEYSDMTAKASFSGKTTWPNGIVPYIFNSAVPSGDRTTILNAMK